MPACLSACQRRNRISNRDVQKLKGTPTREHNILGGESLPQTAKRSRLSTFSAKERKH